MMTRLFLFLAFMGFSVSGYSQYGRLEPLSPGDTTLMVMRTPKETLEKLSASEDKQVRRLSEQIRAVERSLDLWRAGFLMNRIPTPNMTPFINTLKALEKQGVATSNYIQEALFYKNRQ